MTSFLHSSCKGGMCTDCVQIAEEYAELLEVRTRALASAQSRVEELERELATSQRKAAMWEESAKLGLTDIIKAWMDDVHNKAFQHGLAQEKARQYLAGLGLRK